MIALALAQLFLPEMPPWCRESSDSVVSRLLNSLIACQDVPGCQRPYLLSKQGGRLHGSSSYNQILFWRLCGLECGLWAPVNCVAIVIVDGAFFDHDKQHLSPDNALEPLVMLCDLSGDSVRAYPGDIVFARMFLEYSAS